MGEDVVEGLLRGYAILACDVGKVVDNEAEVLGKEVGREAGGKARDDTLKVIMGMHKVSMVTGIGHNDICRRKRWKVETVDDRALKGGDSPTLLGTDLHIWDGGWHCKNVMRQVCFVEYSKEMLAGRQGLHTLNVFF